MSEGPPKVPEELQRESVGENVTDLQKVRQAVEWIRTAEALLVGDSPFQRHLMELEALGPKEKELAVQLFADAREAYHALAKVYREQMEIDDAVWRVARNR